MNGTTNAMLAGVEALIRQHKKIHAIKEYRALTGSSLQVAKDAVEWFEAQGRWPGELNVQAGPGAVVDAQPAVGEQLSAIQAALSHGQKIEAIKLYRESTGVGLKEAKDAVEYFQAYGRWQERTASEANSTVSTAFVERSGAERLGEAERALARGQKIEAIRLYREVYDAGLKEAKDAVEAYAASGIWPSHEFPLRRDPVREGLPEAAPSPSDAPGASRGVAVSGIASSAYAANTFTSSVSSLGSSVSNAATGDARWNAASAVLRTKLGAASVLGSVAAECGLYKGFLFITDQRIAFVADRFGNWEVTEDIARNEVERVEVKEDPFGHEIVIQAGFHSAHFSELSRSTAESLCGFLKGETRQLEVESANSATAPTLTLPSEFSPTASAVPEFSPPGQSFAHQAAIPGERQDTKHPPLGSPAPGPTMELPARTPASAGASVLGAVLLSVFASIPATVYGSAWRLIPMDAFPRIADTVLFWAALALGGTLMRGDASRLLRAGFIAGLLDWAITDLGGMHIWGTLVPCVILGAAFGRRDKDDHKGLMMGAALAVPVVALNAILRLVSLEVFILPTLPFAFWCVHFAASALRKRRALISAQA